MFGEASAVQNSWPLEPGKREAVINSLIHRFSKLFDSESLADIERIVRTEENNAFTHSHTYNQYWHLLTELLKQAEKASKKSLAKNSVEPVESIQNNWGTSETRSLNVEVKKRDKSSKVFPNPQEQKKWRFGTGNLLLSPLHYDKNLESSEVTSTASSDRNNVALHRCDERQKFGFDQRPYGTSSEVVGTTKRVLPSNPSVEKGVSAQDAFIALKNKYKIPFRFLNGVVPIIQDEAVCPKELKHRIQQLARFLDLEKREFTELNVKSEVLMKLETTMETILHMFRPLLKEVVQWVETFGHSIVESETSHSFNHLSFSSEEKSSNNSSDLLRKNSFHHQSTSVSEQKQTNPSTFKKFPRTEAGDTFKVENEESYVSNETNKDMLQWNDQLQTAASKTVESMKNFMKHVSQSNTLKEQRLHNQIGILKKLKAASCSANVAADQELCENLQWECLSVEQKYPHLHHELFYDAVIYIICKAKCSAIQLPFLFLFPNLGNDGSVLFVIQKEACGESEFGQVLRTQLQKQLSAESAWKSNVSSILKVWGSITQSFIELTPKTSVK